MSPARRLSDRHPFEIYLLGWAFLSSFPAAVGVVKPPGTVQSQLGTINAHVWVIGLSLGCLISLVGLAWKRPQFPLITVTGLLLEQVGLVIVGGTTMFYAAVAMTVAGVTALIPAGIVLAFGLACFAQASKIRAVLRDSRPTS